MDGCTQRASEQAVNGHPVRDGTVPAAGTREGSRAVSVAITHCDGVLFEGLTGGTQLSSPARIKRQGHPIEPDPLFS